MLPVNLPKIVYSTNLAGDEVSNLTEVCSGLMIVIFLVIIPRSFFDTIESIPIFFPAVLQHFTKYSNTFISKIDHGKAS